MNWPRAIIHIDMDTFFVSVERKHDPSLIGKPVIVGGGPGGNVKRGVVAACSYEARKFGVRSAMPLAQAMKLCPQAILVSVGTSDYGVETARVREKLETFTDLVEMTSPDEAYIDLAGTERLHGTPIQAAHALREKVASRVGLPVSVGLATSKTIAKIASKLSKPRGLFVVFPGMEADVTRPLALRALPGLGPKTEAILKSKGLLTLGELCACSESKLIEWLGDHGASLRRRAMGDCASEVQPSRERIQISTEETFGDDIGDREVLHAELSRMSMKIGAMLRRRNQWAGTISIKIRHPDFSTHGKQQPLEPATRDDQVILKKSKELLKQVWNGAPPLRLLGIGVSNLLDAAQSDFLNIESDTKREKLLKIMDTIREKEGRDKISWAGAAHKRKRKMKDGAGGGT